MKKSAVNQKQNMSLDFKKRFWISLIFSIPVLLLSPMIQEFLRLDKIIYFPGELYLLFILSTFIFFYGGKPFLKGLLTELQKKSPGMMTLIGVAITTAYIYSSAVVFGLEGKLFFWELATLIVVMLLGHWIEMRSVLGASRALEELSKLVPGKSHIIISNDIVQEIATDKLKIGDKVLIKPGEKVPVDGEIYEGQTSIDESMLTGETSPVLKNKKNIVIAGSINGEGTIKVIVKKIGKDSFLSQVVKLVKEAQSSKSKTQNLANKAAFFLTIIGLSAGGITFVVWLFFSSQNLAFAIERMVTVMVITCPHALGLAVPLVIAVSTSLAARNGFLIRNRASFERARMIETIIFDKTGTLTEGEFSVTDVIKIDNNYTKEEILKLAASIEFYSEHSIAKGIVKEVSKKYSVSNFKAIIGKGAEGVVNGKKIMVVSPGYLSENNLTLLNENVTKLKNKGETLIYVLMDNVIIGVIALSDVIRQDSQKAIKALKKMGIKSIMITGDNDRVASSVSKELGIDEFFAGVLPEDKVKKIKAIQGQGVIVSMVGDGINDAPALAQSDVGIAIGVGTDVAIETADIILVKNNLLDVVSVIKLSRSTYHKLIQNLIWATGYNIVAIPVAAGVLFSWGILLNPAFGALFMSLSTVIVSINAKFLKVKK